MWQTSARADFARRCVTRLQPLTPAAMADESHSQSQSSGQQHGEAAEADLSQSVSLPDLLQSSVQLPLRDLDAAVLADIRRAYPHLTDLNLESNGDHQPARRPQRAQ